MVNAGYQVDDAAIIDYGLWRLPGTDLDIRGPMVDVSPSRYFTVIGAAQTFGRFVQRSYGDIVSEHLGARCLNLGFSGAGPTFFTDRPPLMDYINHSQFAIVQMMSGRSISNSRFTVASNQGLAWRVGNSKGMPQFAENAYSQFMETATPEELVALRPEIRARYISEMTLLLNRIKVPKILLYWSTQPANQARGRDNIHNYWGGFPHFVDAEVIDVLRPLADGFVSSVSARGLPQPLFDKQTGLPVELWPEDKFPRVQLRNHNHYYPSPEMHEDAAKELIPNVPPKKAPRHQIEKSRDILVHVHIFKNAGSSVDAQLARQLGEGFVTFDPPRLVSCVSQEDILELVRENASIRAVSSHQLRFPIHGEANVRLLPFLFLRHPIDRVESIYQYERRPDRQATSTAPHTKMASESTFAEFIEWCLVMPWQSAPIANYQTRMCSLRHNGTKFEDWSHLVDLTNFKEAMEFMSQMPFVGVVDEFEKSIAYFNTRFYHLFDGLRLANVRENATRTSVEPLHARLAAIRRSLGEQTYNKLLDSNQYDLALYEFGRRRIGCG